MSAQKILYVFSQAPYSTAGGQEAIDAVLIGAAFEQDVSLLFIHDGVFQLKTSQDNSQSQLKQYTRTFAALGDHGVENFYAHDISLRARGLLVEDLMLPVEELDSEGTADLIRGQFRVFTF